MSPELAAKLMSDVPEMREFVAYILGECAKLDTISDIDPTFNNDHSIATEVVGRKRAYEKLTRILTPLLNPQSPVSGGSSKDFAM